MSDLETRPERRGAKRYYSASEASFVTRLPRKAVEQAITRREIATKPGRRATDAAQNVGEAELVYLESRKSLVNLLTRDARRKLYRALSGAAAGEIPSTVEVGTIEVKLDDVKARVRERLAQLDAVREHVAEDPAVCGGVPVVRGTRIPVHALAQLARQGAPTEELLEDYPALTAASLEAALLYARIHPRRGRPPAAPWRAGAPRRVYSAEELNGG
jgi:uncharacterized protein (DUF433 family)